LVIVLSAPIGLLSQAPSPALAAPGDLDSTFGTGGKVTTDFGGDDFGRKVAIQTGGKIVVAGEASNNFALARYNTDGSLDSTFGGTGKVTPNFGNAREAFELPIQTDGKIVVSGTVYQ